MSEHSDQIKALEERIARLERQVAILAKRTGPSAARPRGDYRDRYDALEYPER